VELYLHSSNKPSWRGAQLNAGTILHLNFTNISEVHSRMCIGHMNERKKYTSTLIKIIKQNTINYISVDLLHQLLI
jgi:hypothetical protein